MRATFQNRMALLALGGGLPATALATWAAWHHAPTAELRIVSVALLLVVWLGCALLLRRRLEAPLHTLANLIEAIRFGDFTLRGRRGAPGDALGEVVREVNTLGETLQQQRLASLEATALVQTVLEELDAAVFAFDESRQLRLANRAAAELLGRSPESLIGRSAAALGLEELLARAGQASGPAVAALAFPGRSGRFEVRQRSFRESGLPHTLVMVSDLSRTLREEERRAWQRLIRVVGHEINNSLAPIKSVAGTLRDMLAGRLPADERADTLEGLGLIADRAESLSKFVATYSQLARLPAPTRAPTRLDQLLHRLAALPAYAGVRVAASEPISVEVDAGQIEQVLINLLKNALEASGTAEGVELRLSRTRDAVRVEVCDAGQGIANPDNLFVPFFTTKPGGTGIGLALSRQIAESHGGSLTLENRTDAGGCIARLTLPAGD